MDVDDLDLLGNLYADLKRLHESLERLDNANIRLGEANARMKEANGRLADAVTRLREANIGLAVSMVSFSGMIDAPQPEEEPLTVKVEKGSRRGTVVPIRERRRKKQPLAPADEAKR